MSEPIVSTKSRLVLASLLILGVAGIGYWLADSSSVPNTSERRPTGSEVVASNNLVQTLPATKEIMPKVDSSRSSIGATLVPALEGSSVSFSSTSRTGSLSGGDGVFDRLYIAENEKISFKVDLDNLRLGNVVDFSAPHGGRLRLNENAPLTFLPKSKGAAMDLTFEPTLGPGAYTIEIRHAGEVRVIDLWSGETAPLGQPTNTNPFAKGAAKQ